MEKPYIEDITPTQVVILDEMSEMAVFVKLKHDSDRITSDDFVHEFSFVEHMFEIMDMCLADENNYPHDMTDELRANIVEMLECQTFYDEYQDACGGSDYRMGEYVGHHYFCY